MVFTTTSSPDKPLLISTREVGNRHSICDYLLQILCEQICHWHCSESSSWVFTESHRILSLSVNNLSGTSKHWLTQSVQVLVGSSLGSYLNNIIISNLITHLQVLILVSVLAGLEKYINGSHLVLQLCLLQLSLLQLGCEGLQLGPTFLQIILYTAQMDLEIWRDSRQRYKLSTLF